MYQQRIWSPCHAAWMVWIYCHTSHTRLSSGESISWTLYWYHTVPAYLWLNATVCRYIVFNNCLTLCMGILWWIIKIIMIYLNLEEIIISVFVNIRNNSICDHCIMERKSELISYLKLKALISGIYWSKYEFCNVFVLSFLLS